MKYWNRDKQIRQQHWYPVRRSVKAGWNYLAIKRCLQLHDSTGKFYLYHAGEMIWFEREADALWFALTA